MSAAWVFIVGGDADRRQTMQADLERAGYEVETAPSVESMLGSLSIMRPVMVVVDEDVIDMDRLREALAPRVVRDSEPIHLMRVAGKLP